jgi:hypothetical protein
MRINLNNGRANATIYTNPTPQQLDWLKKNDITRDELDIRRGTEVEYGDSSDTSDQYSVIVSKISELNINEFSRQLEQANDLIESMIGNVTSSFDKNYRRVDKAENPNNLPEDQVQKLTKIYLSLKDAGTNLFTVEDLLSES